MAIKKGKILPKMGKILHRASRKDESVLEYASAIAIALRQELGTSRRAIKSAMRWTGASERTVKYWFAGTRGPSGEHLIALARHSDAILEVFLRHAGRSHHAGTIRLLKAHETLKSLVETVRRIIDDRATP